MSITFTHLTQDPRKNASGKSIGFLETQLTVPTTMDDLAEMVNNGQFKDHMLLWGEKEIVLGKLADGKRNYVKVPALVAAVIESMKLWQNAKVAASVRPKQNLKLERDRAMLEIINLGKDDEVFMEFMGELAKGPEAKEAYLDAYLANEPE